MYFGSEVGYDNKLIITFPIDSIRLMKNEIRKKDDQNKNGVVCSVRNTYTSSAS